MLKHDDDEIKMKNDVTRSLEGLNDKQFLAAAHTEGPTLILAGAGSGKTRVLVHRIAHLIEDLDVSPGRILAITFTNKAAEEMRTRVDRMIGFGAGEIWVSTFHACCVRILRRDIEKLGYTRYFSIYDTDDQLRVVKDIFHRMDVDPKQFKEKSVLNAISRAKDELIGPEEYARRADGEFETLVSRVYPKYEEALFGNNALDFDDLLVKTVGLFRAFPEVLAFYQEKFRYIHVDEYQDTNTVQFVFASLLAGKYRNLCVVGDDDQSIYRFRGANIANILQFEEKYPDAFVVRLEQNYRSTKRILSAANAVIANNRGRKVKKLWTENEDGGKVRFLCFENGWAEADFVISDISGRVRRGAAWKDHAVLYRTNAQSRLFEEKLIYANIPYKVVGGVNFYSRLEIKDILSYLKTIDNGADALAVRRIINVPRRGIGDATIEKIIAFAEREGAGFYDTLLHPETAGITARTAAKIRQFTDLIGVLRGIAEELSTADLLREVLKRTGYLAELEAEHTEEADGRIENLEELISKAAVYDETAEEPSLSGFLEEVALIADIDTVSDSDDVVLIMTLHASKGLEFPHVYITGLEDGLFPGYLAVDSGDEMEMEEERRLMYVGMTRAKRSLTLCAARSRMQRGNMIENPVSRFVRELPENEVEADYGRPQDFGEGQWSRRGAYGGSFRGGQAYGEGGMPYGTRKTGRDGQPGSGGQTAYREAGRKETVRPENPYAKKKQFSVKAASLPYGVGDTVLSARFGKGVVREITEGGRDYEVTVEFNDYGVKKMFASFANLKPAD